MYYILNFFHLPLLKRMIPAMAIKVSATGIATKTPVGPIFMVKARKYASGIWKNQKPKRLSIVGV